MNTNNEGGIARPETQRKDTKKSLKYQVLNSLKSERLTAIMINSRFCISDARKLISDLRKEGYSIMDSRLCDGRKVYYFLHDMKGGDYD